MYTLTNPKDEFYIHFQCECGRKFRAEEMYICYNCNKILCRYCLDTEYEIYGCKNNCKRSQNFTINSVRKKNNCCDLCLECPICFNALIKRKISGNFLYQCPFCYWDTANIKLAKPSENDLDILIGQLQETGSNGFLKKMYNHLLENLSKNYVLTEEYNYTSNINEFEKIGKEDENINFQEVVQKAMESGAWNIEKLNENIKKEKEKYENIFNSPYDYNDDYINDKNNNYFSFNFISTLLGCNLDLSEKDDINSIDDLKKKLKTDLDINYICTLDQRLNHVIFQHPLTSVQFPKFFDLVPQKTKVSRKCKKCKKLIIQGGDQSNTRSNYVKLEVSHFFLIQFPHITIYKIEYDKKNLMLKFNISDYKEIKLNFKESTKSEVKCVLPPKKYEIGTNNKMTKDEYLFAQNEKFIILNFKWKGESEKNIKADGKSHYLQFIIVAEYNRGGSETNTVIEYNTEIKFHVKKDKK